MVRSNGATPEIEKIGDYYPLNVYKITLEEQEFYNYNPINDIDLWILRTGYWDDGGVWVPEGIWKSGN